MAKMVKMRAIGGRADGKTFELPHATVEYLHREALTPVVTVEQPYRVFEVAGVEARMVFLAPAGWNIDNLLTHIMSKWQPAPPPPAQVGF